MPVVATDAVKIAEGYEPSDRDVRKIAPYIERDGLIEPLKMSRDGTIGRLDHHDPARLEYCRRAGWPTVIVAFDE